MNIKISQKQFIKAHSGSLVRIFMMKSLASEESLVNLSDSCAQLQDFTLPRVSETVSALKGVSPVNLRKNIFL